MTHQLPRAPASLVLGVALLGAVLLLDGCTRDGSGDPGPTGRSAAPGALEVRGDLVAAQAVPWSSWRSVGEATLEFTVTAGSPDCYAARPAVHESASQVRVRIEVGRVPETADQDCPAIALTSVVPVRLAAPLGDRTVRPMS